MPTFFERVRTALAPKGYEVAGDRELGNGGMGIVVLARQTRLKRLVAIKVIRPEMHTAVAVARFVREAQTLAKVPHPHIVQVFEADEADGLPYYVMQYLDGPSVADRLDHGPIPRAQVQQLGHGLLDALEHAHARGVVHRDVKPANLFWDGKRAVLVDFGIAKRVAAGSERTDGFTEPGVQPGTRAYMAPEQLAGDEATPLSDAYAAALVIYEAYSGRQWLDAQQSRWRVWRGVPLGVRSVLRRALAWKPEQRWPDVATFNRRLSAAPGRFRLQTGGLVAAGLIGGAILLGVARPARGLRLNVASFADRCAPGAGAGDRVARALVRDLQGYADFSVAGPTGWSWLAGRSRVQVLGSVCARADSIDAEITLVTAGVRLNPTIMARGDTGHLDALADTLSYGVVREIWNRDNQLDAALPLNALPRTAQGLAAWLLAERLFAQARWGEADGAYAAAETIDSSCWLCLWRHAEVEKWLGRPFDTTRAAGYLSHRGSFPAHYQAVIRASREPLRRSLETLRQVVRERPSFLPALFMLADETYHRGPLIGLSSREAIQAFQAVASVRPDFLPAAEHLTWVMTAAGEERGARDAYQRLMESGPSRDAYAQELRALLGLGLTCRFEDRAHCRDAIDAALAQVGAAQYPDLAAGPRYLMTFDTPAGAVEFGRRFAERHDAPALLESGLVAEMSGYLALGLPDSAGVAALALRGLGRPELTILPAELEGALLLLDPGQGDERSRWTQTSRDLVAHTRSTVSTAATRRRAAWMLVLLARRLGALPDSDRYLRLLEGETGRRPLATLSQADRLADAGRFADALRMTDSLTPLQADSLGDPAAVDPFFRAALHLLRARWDERRHDSDAVGRDLQWYENNDVTGRPSGPPQVADVDWGFRTVARWRLATLLDAARDPRACALYRAVGRAWSAGDALHRARADSAAARVSALRCPGTS